MTRRQQMWIGGGALAALLLFASPARAAIPAIGRPPVRGGAKAKEIKKWCDKWGKIFNIPGWVAMAISKIETGWRPDSVNLTVRSIPLGGAWGAFQMTVVAANDFAKRLASSKNAEVRAVLSLWTGRGQDLIDNLNLASLLATAYLSTYWKEFGGDWKLVAAAYHQGAGKVRKMLKAGQKIPAELPPKGKIYLAKATAAESAAKAVA